jgi:predicted DNA-binding transcriptional regulator AlpA
MHSDVNDTDAAAAPEGRSGKLRPMLNAAQVLALIPISPTTLFRLERDKLFPQGKAITPHRKLWFEDKVIAWQGICKIQIRHCQRRYVRG